MPLPLIADNLRPNSPQDWRRAGVPIQLAWHHVIPYFTLRAAWNSLVTQFFQTRLAEAQTALHQYMALCGWNAAEIQRFLPLIRRNQMSVPDADLLATAAVWPAWNIVEGPANRTDDPADHYIDRFTHGLTRLEYARMLEAESFNDVLGTFNANPMKNGPVLGALANRINHARQRLACDAPIPFRPDMWVQDGATWRKRRNGEQFIPG
jgi:hypothetical protein